MSVDLDNDNLVFTGAGGAKVVCPREQFSPAAWNNLSYAIRQEYDFDLQRGEYQIVLERGKMTVTNNNAVVELLVVSDDADAIDAAYCGGAATACALFCPREQSVQ